MCAIPNNTVIVKQCEKGIHTVLIPARVLATVKTVSTLGLVVVVLTLTRVIKSVVTGQAPVTLEMRNIGAWLPTTN